MSFTSTYLINHILYKLLYLWNRLPERESHAWCFIQAQTVGNPLPLRVQYIQVWTFIWIYLWGVIISPWIICLSRGVYLKVLLRASASGLHRLVFRKWSDKVKHRHRICTGGFFTHICPIICRNLPICPPSKQHTWHRTRAHTWHITRAHSWHMTCAHTWHITHALEQGQSKRNPLAPFVKALTSSNIILGSQLSRLTGIKCSLTVDTQSCCKAKRKYILKDIM